MQRKEIKGLLIDNIKECVPYLIPNGNFYRERTYVGNCDGDTITVKIVGKEAGNWRNFTKGISGDIIDLWTLVKGDINSAKKWLNTKENTTEHKITSFSARHYLNDKSPMPKDIIGPRILTPSGLLVIGGTPKIGKSNFLLSMLVHLAAGVSFLGMKPARPLKIFYLQNEMEYRERLQKLRISKKTLDAGTENLVITQKIKLTLNVEEIKEIMYENLDVKTVDVIVIDSLFDYRSMISFLKNDVDKLRSITNPMAGVIFTHYTKKVSTTTLKKNPFRALSGDNVLRSLYTSGIMIFRPERNTLQLMYELKNGKPIPTKFINMVNGRWIATA
ncbi:AAA family ATPase [Wolbachia endosymbiont (group B) of Agrotis puta]